MGAVTSATLAVTRVDGHRRRGASTSAGGTDTAGGATFASGDSARAGRSGAQPEAKPRQGASGPDAGGIKVARLTRRLRLVAARPGRHISGCFRVLKCVGAETAVPLVVGVVTLVVWGVAHAAAAGSGWSLQSTPNIAGPASGALSGVSCTTVACVAVGNYTNAASVRVTLAERTSTFSRATDRNGRRAQSAASGAQIGLEPRSSPPSNQRSGHVAFTPPETLV